MSKTKNRYRTSHICPRNSFWTGLGSIFNIFGNYYDFNYSKSEIDADAKAIANDWNMVGQDMKDVLKQHAKKKPSKHLVHH